MSALTARGSTRRWREIRSWILLRDGKRCRAPVDAGECGALATTVGHKIRREHGGGDELANLRAECSGCNFGERPSPPKAPAATLRQLAIATRLDALGLPVTVGWRRATPALAAVGVRARRGDIAAACQWRRARGSLIRL